MTVLRNGLREMIARPDWTLLSLAVYLATPIIWWRMARTYVPYPSLVNLALSTLILSGGLIAYLRSRTTWQKATSLQVGLTLAPSTFDILSSIFHSNTLDWMRGTPLSPLTAAGIYAAFGLPWLGLMFAPALIAPRPRLIVPARPPSVRVDPAPVPGRKAATVWSVWPWWSAATIVGFGGPLVLSASVEITYPLGMLLYATLLGVLQWLVLRRHCRGAGWWIVATTAGVVLGTHVGVSYTLQDLYIGRRGELDPILTWSTFGAALGMAQWLMLRRRLEHAYVWVLANVLLWPAAWAISNAISFTFVQGMVVGVGTGLVLVWLLRRPWTQGPQPATSPLPGEPAEGPAS